MDREAILSLVPQLLEKSESATRVMARMLMLIRFTWKFLREISIGMLAVPNFRGKGNVWLLAKRMFTSDGHCERSMTPVCAFDANVSEWQIMRVTAWILSEMIF
jgi:hypothetical protein